MLVNTLIKELRRYSTLTIDEQIANHLQNQLRDIPNHIFDTSNFAESIPDWKNMKSIEITFVYQPNFDGLYMYVITITKENIREDDYDWLKYESPFYERMCDLITNDSVYKKEYVSDCFSKELLKEFEDLKIKYIIGNCSRGYDT